MIFFKVTTLNVTTIPKILSGTIIYTYKNHCYMYVVSDKNIFHNLCQTVLKFSDNLMNAMKYEYRMNITARHISYIYQ